MKFKDKALSMIRQGESDAVEFKQSFDREAIESLAAFANTNGGHLFIGVGDDGGIVGIDIGKETLQNWINQVKLVTSNALIPDAEAFDVDSKWDCTIDDTHSEADISLEKVQQFLHRIGRAKETPVLEDPLTMLRKFELLRDGRLTRAAFLLFMAEESSQSTIELGRFQTQTLIKDGARLKTDLFSEVDGVMDFVKKHINKAYIITGAAQREERWDYPMPALREIVINAIVHRDYTSTSDSIVKIFDDRIEIYNPGRLMPGLTVEKLLSGDYVSSIRNRKIADMFKEVGLIEKYGTGIRRVLDGFAGYGLPEPRFEEVSGGFRVTAYKSTGSNDAEQVAEHVTEHVTEHVNGDLQGLLSFCEEPKSRRQMMEHLGYKHREHFRSAHLNQAVESGLLEPTIPHKPKSRLQKYRLTEKGKEILKKRSSGRCPPSA